MKLIMENWRKYLAEQEQKVGSGLLSNDPKQREFARLISKEKEKWKWSINTIGDNKCHHQ